MPRLLITGFEPFVTDDGEVLQYNPSALVAKDVTDRIRDSVSHILPVSFSRAPIELEALFDKYKPTTWVGLGLAANRSGIDVETVAVNLSHSRGVDNDGQRMSLTSVVPGAPLALRAPFDVEGLVANLRTENVAANISTSAGSFVCNYSFYFGCWRASDKSCPQNVVFIHIGRDIEPGEFSCALARALSRVDLAVCKSFSKSI